ncbi:hypothetical protein D8674_030342 [Pyrus ussuriensis x Pyrus communis]|uniref:Uncharacterized protein n=1 Tax=Pyrus ussuriensis x Pyrus communis TaxID=2448454 RepID=A0A5N5F0T7_9ROSA|nr:hypothetical protein D8674_030342 [Pyrus ussuriensis x Pyrus communis]
MLRFPFDEGGVLRELQIVKDVFRQLCQLTERSIKIVSDQLSIVDITLLSPVSLELSLLAFERSNLHITRPPILILTAVFLPFEDFSIICRHFQIVSSKENMVYHFKPVEKFMEIFENVWISWITQLIGMHHKGALNMESLMKLQMLLPFTGVMFKYMNPMAATYISSENQRHVFLFFRIDFIVLRTASDKYWDSEEYVTWCHFNVACNVDLMADVFITHTTHVLLMERYFSGPATSMSPTHVQPPVTTFVHGLVFHLRKHELDNVSVGMITQVAATFPFLSLFTWSDVLSRNFVVADLFYHHAKVRVTLANMRAILEFGRWFSLVHTEIIINDWKLYYVRRECNHNTLLIALALVNMIHILYGEGIPTLLSRGGQGSNNTEWKRNAYLIHLFTYAVQSNKSAVIWFLTSDGSSAAWIRHVCSVVDQMTNPFDGVQKCFDYWKSLADLALFLQQCSTSGTIKAFNHPWNLSTGGRSLRHFLVYCRTTIGLHSLSLGSSYSLSFGSAIYGRICL